jgi:hypothetical protein
MLVYLWNCPWGGHGSHVRHTITASYTEAVTPEGKLRFADYTWDVNRRRLIAVCESHENASSDGATGVVNTVVAVGKTPAWPRL